MNELVWTKAKKARLRVLWASDMSTQRIGLELALTKNAVIGMAHRLKLKRRASPIPPRGAVTAQAPTPVPPAIAPVVVVAIAGPAPAKRTAEPSTTPDSQIAEAGQPPAVAAAVVAPIEAETSSRAVMAAPVARVRPQRSCEDAVADDGGVERGPPTCRYPIGDPGTAGFHYCRAPRRLTRSYCDAHHAIAWISTRKADGPASSPGLGSR